MALHLTFERALRRLRTADPSLPCPPRRRSRAQDLPPAEQYRRATATAAKSLLGGTALVVLFSEPMVGVLSEIARRSGVAPFYVAFVLAPIAVRAARM